MVLIAPFPGHCLHFTIPYLSIHSSFPRTLYLNGQAVSEQKMFKIVVIFMFLALGYGQKNFLSLNISTNINFESLCSFAVSFSPSYQQLSPYKCT